METTTKTTLDALIQDYLNAKEEYTTFKNMPELKAPQLKKAYTIPEYNEYVEAVSKWQVDSRVRTAHYDLAKKRFGSLREKILNDLPASHVWFMSEDNKYAIAIQRSDWPMDPPVIMIQENPKIKELPQLKLQIVSAN